MAFKVERLSSGDVCHASCPIPLIIVNGWLAPYKSKGDTEVLRIAWVCYFMLTGLPDGS